MNTDDRVLLTIAGSGLRVGWLEAEFMDRIGLTAIRAWQRINRLIDTQEAEAEFPVLVHRLRRLRDQRRAARAA